MTQNSELRTQNSSIAILQLGRLGDMILSTPLFYSMKQCIPECTLTVIASEKGAVIAEHCPAVDNVISVPEGFLQIPTLTAKLRSPRYDLFIDPKDHQSNTSRITAELVRAKLWVGIKGNSRFRGKKVLLAKQDAPMHYTDRMLAPLRQLFPDTEFSRTPRFTVPDSAFGAIDRQLTIGDKPGFIAINVSAGDASRYWDPKKWIMLIDRIAERYSVIVLYAPGEHDLADSVCRSRREAHPVRTESIIEAAAAIARSRAVISPDTSIIHIASMLNTPTVGLYPPDPNNMISFAPLATRSLSLSPLEGGMVADISVDEVEMGLSEVLHKK